MHNKLISSLAGAAFSFAVSGLAFAADMAVKMPVKAPPPPAPVYSWTGWYVGGNVGAIWSEAATSVSNLAAFAPAAGGSYLFPVNYPTIAAVGTNNLTNTGFLGGIQAGYNWQISSLVLGAEADFSGTTASGTVNASAPYPVTPSPASFFWATSVREDYFATIRGRAGYAAGPVLIYGTGGLAIADVRFAKTFTDNFSFPPGAFGQVAVHEVMTGWTAGGGVEVAVAPNWTVKGEYLYADLGSLTGAGVVTNPLFTGGDTFSASAHVRNSIVRVGFNYKFGS